jgi:hypothetical protein
MIVIKFFTWLINLFQDHMESRCLVDTTNFIMTKNHFNHFLNYICIFWYVVTYMFWQKYTLTSHHIRLKSVVSLEFDLFGF